METVPDLWQVYEEPLRDHSLFCCGGTVYMRGSYSSLPRGAIPGVHSLHLVVGNTRLRQIFDCTS